MNKRELIKKADTLFAKQVKSIGSRNGYNYCYTCGALLPVSQLQCGHFYSRRFTATRWDFDNARPQCFNCNVNLKGNLKIFAEKLKDEIGEQQFYELTNRAKQLHKLTISELECVILDLINLNINEH